MDVPVIGVPVINTDPVVLHAEAFSICPINSRVKDSRFAMSTASSSETMSRK